MAAYYLAVDIGASSGRHILAWMDEGRIRTEEIYRFPNQMECMDGHLVWNMDHLYQEVLNGLKECGKTGRIPSSMGIDTWGVDYALLDENGRQTGPVYAYRDSRTEQAVSAVSNIVSEEELYQRTGIQHQPFNTIFQLMDDREQGRLEHAQSLLMVPDYLNFLLSGVKKQEYTNASTTGLLNAETGTWDEELIGRLGYPEHLFQELSQPGTVIGHFLPAVRETVGFDTEIILPCTHDTGSAVLAVPSVEKEPLYISSGTWSLLGVEKKEADCRQEGRKANFTNEGGYGNTIRYLRNIMGLWMIQNVQKELEGKYSFSDLCNMAEEAACNSIVDVNDACFLAPASMIGAVKEACRKSGQTVPQTAGETARVVYRSLAHCYGETVKQLEELQGCVHDAMYIIGGGCKALYLNQLTADALGRIVYAGPSEATAIGNIGVQMIHAGVFGNAAEFRSCVRNSFEVKTCRPVEK